MKLLFDQNISFRLINKIQDLFPEAKQVTQVGLEDSSDSKIWEYAQKYNYIIVTFDADFFDISVLKGYPPKIVWIRTGNLTTSNLEKLLRQNASIIGDFEKTEDIGCLEIFN